MPPAVLYTSCKYTQKMSFICIFFNLPGGDPSTSRALLGGNFAQVAHCLEAFPSKSHPAWTRFQASCSLPGGTFKEVANCLEPIFTSSIFAWRLFCACRVLPVGVSVRPTAICLEAISTHSLLAWTHFLTSRKLPLTISVCASSCLETSSSPVSV